VRTDPHELLRQLEIVAGLPFVAGDHVALVAERSVIREAGKQSGEDEVQALRVLLRATEERQVIPEATRVIWRVEDVGQDPPAIRLDPGEDRRAVEPVDELEEVEDRDPALRPRHC